MLRHLIIGVSDTILITPHQGLYIIIGIFIHSGHQVSRDIGWLECGREEKEVEEVFNNITDIATIIEYHFLSQNFQRALDKVKGDCLSHITVVIVSGQR